MGNASLFLTVLLLGLAIAVSSPTSVVTMIVLLTIPAGRRRGIAFVVGWLLAIGVIGLLCVLLLHPQDFSSHKTTPSRVTSTIEIAAGAVAVIVGALALRRGTSRPPADKTARFLQRLDRTSWWLAVPVGALMLTYSLTLAAAAEILKANVSAAKAALAFVVFAIASILTVAAPLVVVFIAPERSAERLARWRQWLVGNARTIGLMALIVVGALVIAKGIHDLVA